MKRARCVYCGKPWSDQPTVPLTICEKCPALLADSPIHLCPECTHVRTAWSVFISGVPDWDSRGEAEEWLRKQGGTVVEKWEDTFGKYFSDEYHGGTVVEIKGDKALVRYTWDDGANWHTADGTRYTLGRIHIHGRGGRDG